jgi:two-component system osmolarity sensor histidine kinase EnvZ
MSRRHRTQPGGSASFAPPMERAALAFNVFWRTFVLLGLLLAAGIFAWVQTLRALDLEPRAVHEAQQIASLVNLSRAALKQADGITRVSLMKSIDGAKSVRVRPREPADKWEPYEVDRFTRLVGREVRQQLGADAIIARSVNGQAGLWVGFLIDADNFWLYTDPAHTATLSTDTLVSWIGIALLATLLGSAAIASLINKPLKQLSFAASRIREGDLDSRLDENTMTSEIREVNRGFNRMARELAKVEEARAVMLAGISHDLRTPLARLRLEAEMSVSDEEAKRNIADDIAQLDAIIDKFMDYARPGDTAVKPIHVARLIDREAAAFRDPSQIRITSRVAIDLKVMADDVELGRVFLNLFENARRYGRSDDTGIADVQVSYSRTGPWVIITVRDHGQGVAPSKLGQLTTPFFRGDAARTAATGAGLGLAIVEKAMSRMGASLELVNAPDGGFMAHLRLKRAP